MAERPGRLDGKVALICGAGTDGKGIGNGRAIALTFAREGARVALLDAVLAAAQETADLISEAERTLVLQADVTDVDQCSAAVGTVLDRWSRIDILVNVVGLRGYSAAGSVVDVDLDAWDRMMRVNVKSMVITSRCVIPSMRANGGGSIVNLSSIAGMIGQAGAAGPAYPASKAAVIGLSRSMAADHGPEGIRVNCIAPGMMNTPRVAFVYEDADRIGALRSMSAMPAVDANAWDTANAALYLASDESRFVTGVVLPVDGGETSTQPDPIKLLARSHGATRE
jgi:NAD(P)-dependent dehydrogenase (short-subunit alcohol dehydrogenase family)